VNEFFMSEYAIQAEGLSKKYVIGHLIGMQHRTLRDAIVDSFRRVGQGALRVVRPSSAPPDPRREEVWALNDVSFEIKQGERLGVIGRNGAGKSTLLKILSRITDPTRGRVALRGRVASLLEVGTGFHPELTGRENIFLNGAVLGMSKREIKRKFDEIVAFSEVERFLDTPLKRYSSGMQVRLAFAVAAHLEPEILVVDEVLAVGDYAFQKKSLGKMREVAQGGRTVLFVSHDMGAINTFCEKAMLLHKGSVVAAGNTSDVVARYLEGDDRLYSPIRYNFRDHGEFRLMAATAIQNDSRTTAINSRQPVTIEIQYEIVKALPDSRLSVFFRNQKGEEVFSTCDWDEPTEEALNRQAGRFISRVIIPPKLLKTGPLYGTVVFDIRYQRVVFAEPDVLRLDVFDPECPPLSETHLRPGIVAPILGWHMRQVDTFIDSGKSACEVGLAHSQGRE
jgi:lipopolysaccharide transport system ATP-binding protein